MTQIPSLTPAPLVCSIRDARVLLGGIGNTKVWQLVQAGELETVRIGARRMVKLDSIRALVAKGGAA